jgi:hypothetical protein
MILELVFLLFLYIAKMFSVELHGIEDKLGKILHQVPLFALLSICISIPATAFASHMNFPLFRFFNLGHGNLSLSILWSVGFIFDWTTSFVVEITFFSSLNSIQFWIRKYQQTW